MEADDLVIIFCVKNIYFLNVKHYYIFYFKRKYTYQKTSKHMELDNSNNQKQRKQMTKNMSLTLYNSMAQLESKCC